MWSALGLFSSGCILFPAMFKIAVHIQKTYFSSHLNDAAIYSIACRVVSAMQAVFACVSGLIIISNCHNDVLYDSHWLTNFYMWFGAPYFYYDTWAMYQGYWAKHPELHAKPFKYRIKKFLLSQPLIMFHHLIFPIFYFPIILFFRRGLGDFFVGCFFCIEFAVPCLSLRAVLLHLKMEKTLLFALNGILLIGTYACCRVLVFPFMYHAYGHQYGLSLLQVIRKIPIKCNVGCACILVLQVYWLYQMLVILVNTIKSKWSPPGSKEPLLAGAKVQ